MSGFPALALALAMIAAFALIAGGVSLLRRGADRTRGWLMIVAALVLIGNVAVWTV